MTIASPARRYALRVDLADFDDNTRYAEYTDFTIASASEKYRLDLTGFSGNAGWLIILYRKHACRNDAFMYAEKTVYVRRP